MQEPRDRADVGAWRWAALFVAAGGLALGIQIYLLREYLVTLEGDETALGLGLGAWLSGIAVGAVLARSFGGVRLRGVAALALILLGISGWSGVLAARFGRLLLAVPVGELVALGPSLWLALLVFALPGATVGAGFVALAVSAAASGRTRQAIGRLYVYEALGSLTAGLLVSLVMLPRTTPLAGLALLIAAGFAGASPAARARLIAGRWLFPVLSLLALASALGARPVEAASSRARFRSLVQGVPLIAWADTPYQRVDLGGGETRVLYAGGQYVTSFPDPSEDEPRAHEWMLLAEHPAHVLAFGGLETGALRFCLAHRPERVDLVLLDRQAFDLTRPYLDPDDQRALVDPRVRIVFDDPRRFLERSTDAYDLVLNLAPDPVTLFYARSTTVEFFQRVARRLTARGVYVARFSAGVNVQAGQTGIAGAALYRSLGEVFPVVRAAPGPEGLLVAGFSPEAVTVDPDRLAQRYRERGIQSDVFSPELLPSMFPPERVAALEAELAASARRLVPSRDDRPLAFLHALAARQQVAKIAWSPLLAWSAKHPFRLASFGLAPSLLVALWSIVMRSRRGATLATLHATLVTGACGMTWSLMLFFSFQTRVGALYSELGALSALFMFGLGAGGAWAARRAARGAWLLQSQAIALGAALLIACAFAGLGAVGGRGLVGAVHAGLLALAGAATGVLFPSAASALLDRGEPVRVAAGLVELSDHAGAAVAAVFAAVLFVPALGLTLTALLLVLLQLLALGGSALALRAYPMSSRQ